MRRLETNIDEAQQSSTTDSVKEAASSLTEKVKGFLGGERRAIDVVLCFYHLCYGSSVDSRVT